MSAADSGIELPDFAAAHPLPLSAPHSDEEGATSRDGGGWRNEDEDKARDEDDGEESRDDDDNVDEEYGGLDPEEVLAAERRRRERAARHRERRGEKRDSLDWDFEQETSGTDPAEHSIYGLVLGSLLGVMVSVLQIVVAINMLQVAPENHSDIAEKLATGKNSIGAMFLLMLVLRSVLDGADAMQFFDAPDLRKLPVPYRRLEALLSFAQLRAPFLIYHVVVNSPGDPEYIAAKQRLIHNRAISALLEGLPGLGVGIYFMLKYPDAGTVNSVTALVASFLSCLHGLPLFALLVSSYAPDYLGKPLLVGWSTKHACLASLCVGLQSSAFVMGVGTCCFLYSDMGLIAPAGVFVVLVPVLHTVCKAKKQQYEDPMGAGGDSPVDIKDVIYLALACVPGVNWMYLDKSKGGPGAGSFYLFLVSAAYDLFCVGMVVAAFLHQQLEGETASGPPEDSIFSHPPASWLFGATGLIIAVLAAELFFKGVLHATTFRCGSFSDNSNDLSAQLAY